MDREAIPEKTGPNEFCCVYACGCQWWGSLKSPWHREDLDRTTCDPHGKPRLCVVRETGRTPCDARGEEIV